MRYIAGFTPLAVLLGKFDCSNRLNKSDSDKHSRDASISVFALNPISKQEWCPVLALREIP